MTFLMLASESLIYKSMIDTIHFKVWSDDGNYNNNNDLDTFHIHGRQCNVFLFYFFHFGTYTQRQPLYSILVPFRICKPLRIESILQTIQKQRAATRPCIIVNFTRFSQQFTRHLFHFFSQIHCSTTITTTTTRKNSLIRR